MTSRILCHPDQNKSCGACCGMYNHVDHGQSQTTERLGRRTQAFYEEAQVDDEASLASFRKRWEDTAKDKLLTGLPSCPFLGFIDQEPGDAAGSRVGCLVHPLQNDGVDGRDCGVYDRFICEDYLCAAHEVLRKEETQLVIDAIDDSYLYGLLITNPKFVRHLLELVARRNGAMPTAKILEQPAVVEAAGACFELVRHWEYRGDDGIFGQVEVAGALDTTRRPLPAEQFGVDSADVDVLLVCMGTKCTNTNELEEARGLVEERVRQFATAIERESP